MSETKWLPKGELPTSPGIYLSVKDGDGCYWKLPEDFDVLPKRDSSRRFYGPIPDPPKEPPKVRRFIATKGGESVSGVSVEGSDLLAYYFWQGGAWKESVANISCFQDVDFLDN